MTRLSCSRKLQLLVLSGLMTSGMSACTSLSDQNEGLGNARLQEFAQKGDAQSQYNVGLMYTTGEPQDYERAAQWFQKAALQGHQGAQYMLGVSHYVGRGLPSDYVAALNWYQKAADQGHARAQYQLGEIYMNGRGVQKDPAWGALWYGKAAEQGHAEARFSLGVAFASGLGLPKNQVRSCQWLILAENSGHITAAAVREKICTALSNEQLNNAKVLATRWQTRTYTPYQDPPTIRYLQFRLQQLGYKPGYVDGIVGKQTHDAVEKYLADVGANNKLISMEGLVTRLHQGRLE